MSDLVIVESPAKAKTIGKYLGKGYKVKASMGHLRDLPKSTMGVDIEGGFEPVYQPIDGKSDMIDELRKDARTSEHVYLATDPDREGEAISWHLKELLELPDSKAYRVTFNEITQKVVCDSIQKPRKIDMDLVDAQQARRILDRIVGYELSPLLWKKVRRGLSAGRVQSVSTRMVVDRENEIRAFVPEEYWSIQIKLIRDSARAEHFSARFVGTPDSKVELTSEEQSMVVVSAITDKKFSVYKVKHGEKKRSPSPPFITSTLQQDSFRKLGMAPKRTMAVAQQLYEGVDVSGHGTVGLITYMRTDSLRLSEEAITDARNFISGRYGSAYCPASPRRYKSKGSAQDAHEAIRPTYVELTPEDIKSDLKPDQYKLYKLIWSRFVASQMENAVYNTLAIDSVCEGYLFRANSMSIKFAGFTALYIEGRDDEEDDEIVSLPNLTEGEPLSSQDILPQQHFTQPPPRFTEATLIKAMEELGVGRPSTYSPTISTILDREYVVKDGRALKPTPLGEVVTSLMVDKFADIIDLDFTARLEQSLDEIGEGKKNWKATLSDFYGGFSQAMKTAEQDGQRIKIPDEESDVVCDLCGRKMAIKFGRFGRFLSCSGYPECKNAKPLAEDTPGECLLCGEKILKKKSKKGYTYFGCSANPKCSFMTWDTPQADKCPECGKSLFKRTGRGGSKPFCINPDCVSFLPEDKRGYKKKAASKESSSSGEAAEAAAANESAAKPEKKSAKAAKSTASKTKTTAKTSKSGAAAKKAPAKTAAKTKKASTPKKKNSDDGNNEVE